MHVGGQTGRGTGAAGEDAEGGHQAERGLLPVGDLGVLPRGRLEAGAAAAGRDDRHGRAARSQVSYAAVLAVGTQAQSRACP